MNKTVSAFIRDRLKKGLSHLPEDSQHLFKRMYSPNNLEAPIEEVVDHMPDEKLDWALTQVEQSLQKQADELGNRVCPECGCDVWIDEGDYLLCDECSKVEYLW